jgi:hypothetical protein
VVEHLPSKCEALSSNSSTAKKEKEKKTKTMYVTITGPELGMTKK